MNEKVQDFRGLCAHLIGNKAECPGKHLQRTAAFTLGTPIPLWFEGPGEDPALKNQETKCEGKALEVTTALWKVEQESRCFATVSETRRTQH